MTKAKSVPMCPIDAQLVAFEHLAGKTTPRLDRNRILVEPSGTGVIVFATNGRGLAARFIDELGVPLSAPVFLEPLTFWNYERLGEAPLTGDADCVYPNWRSAIPTPNPNGCRISVNLDRLKRALAVIPGETVNIAIDGLKPLMLWNEETLAAVMPTGEDADSLLESQRRVCTKFGCKV
ncbi:MAG: hypothetical protein ABIH03_07100 [Pseudomonadota bacterium]